MSQQKVISMVVHNSSITPEETDEPRELVKPSLCSKTKMALKNITVEPLVVCYILPLLLLNFTMVNLTLEKACRVNLHLDEGTCDALSSGNQSYPGYTASEEAVQTLGANVALWKNIIQGVVTAVLLLFLGSWSDRHRKRKPLMMNPILGEIIICILLLLSVFFFFDLPVEFNVVAESVPYALAGGWFCMYAGTFSYISGVSSHESRTNRIGNVQVAINFSKCVGTALSGMLLDRTGFYGVLCTSLVMFLCGYVYGLFFVKDIWELETKVVRKQNEEKQSFLADFFDTRHIIDTFRSVFTNGSRKRRVRIWWILILDIALTGPLIGESNVSYFFMRYKFGWNAVDASVFGIFHLVTQIFGTMFCLAFFGNYLKLDDSILGIISTGSKIVAAFLYAFGPSSVYYMGALVELLNTTSFIAVRSILSKIVSGDELGKVNSVSGLCESVAPVLYGPFYSTVYAATITFFPGAFYIGGAALTVPSLLIFIWLYTEHRKDELEAQIRMQETMK